MHVVNRMELREEWLRGQVIRLSARLDIRQPKEFFVRLNCYTEVCRARKCIRGSN